MAIVTDGDGEIVMFDGGRWRAIETEMENSSGKETETGDGDRDGD